MEEEKKNEEAESLPAELHEAFKLRYRVDGNKAVKEMWLNDLLQEDMYAVETLIRDLRNDGDGLNFREMQGENTTELILNISAAFAQAEFNPRLCAIILEDHYGKKETADFYKKCYAGDVEVVVNRFLGGIGAGLFSGIGASLASMLLRNGVAGGTKR